MAPPFGPHHSSSASRSVQAFHTTSRGALKVRVTVNGFTVTESLAAIFGSLPFWCLGFVRNGLSRLQAFQIGIKAVEARLPEFPVEIVPVSRLFQRHGLQLAWPPLRLAPARNQPRPFQHLEMFGDGRKAHLARLGEFIAGGLPPREPRQDRAPRRIGKS